MGCRNRNRRGSPALWTRSKLTSSSTAASADDSGMPPAAAASSGSNGSPTTAAPSSASRASSPRSASSSARSAATGAGTSSRGCAERPGELLEVEGIAAALLIQRLHGRLVDLIVQELASLGLRERTDLDPSQHAGAVRALERRGEPAGRLPGPEGGCDEDGSVGRAPEEGAEELDRRSVGPVEVIDEEHERRHGREPLQQIAHRGVHAVAVVVDRGGTASRRRVQRRQDLRERVECPVVECIEAVWLEPPDVFVERVDEDPEGEIALELGCRPAEDEVAMRIGPSGGLGEQAGLPDPRFADQCEHGRRRSVSQAEERLVEDAARLGAPNEVLARADHVGSAQHRSGCAPRTVRVPARCRDGSRRRGSR